MRAAVLSALLLVACNGDPATETPATESPATETPSSFGGFYSDLQDALCPLAVDTCDGVAAQLDCDARSTVPGCSDFDADAALACLQGQSTCDDGVLESDDACDLVCSDVGFSVLSAVDSAPECDAMLACDAALGTFLSGYDPAFDGATDAEFGPGGSCFDDDPRDCVDTCVTAYDGMVAAAEASVSADVMSSVPVACGGTVDPTPAPPTPPTPPPFVWTVTIEDGDQQVDTGGTQDPDTYTVRTENSVANFPDVVEWDFGMAQTEIGPANGWFGEDCDGTVSTGSDICHPLAPDSTMVLQRVYALNEIVAGSTTLMPVDYPESSTPRNAYVLLGRDSGDQVVQCFVFGYEVDYYAFLNCDEYMP